MRATFKAPAIIDPSQIEFAPETYYCRIPLAEQTGTDVTVTGRDSSGDFEYTLAVNNGAAGMWDASNYFEVQTSATEHNATVLTRAMHDICRTDTLEGTILMMGFFGRNGAGANTDYAFCYGNPWAAQGYGLRFWAGRVLDFQIAASVGNTDAVNTTATYVWPDTADTVESYIAHIFGDGGDSDYEFGVHKAGASVASGTTPHDVYSADLKAAILGKSDDSGGITQAAQPGSLWADFLIIRTPLDLRPYLGEISADHSNSPWEMLQTLKRLGV